MGHPESLRSDLKRCPYCLGEHERKGARYCCVGHQRRAAAQNLSAAMKLRRIHAKIDAKIKERSRVRLHWREVAMGRDEQLHLGAIFAPRMATKHRSRRVPEK